MTEPYYRPRLTNVRETGQPRKVGFELEFAGPNLEDAANAVASGLGGEVIPGTAAECVVRVDDLGEFGVEVDWQFGKSLAAERAQSHGRDHEDLLMEWLTSIASVLVPVEIVCPPIPIDRLHRLDAMVAKLRELDAKGTEVSPLYAFGVHINPEVPSRDATTIANYLKAFCIAQDWLVAAHEVDMARRITPYIDLFPRDYVARLLGYTDAITVEQIIDDYLEFNPTRNRALDMLPLFRELDASRLTAVISDERVKARPTFHYRLPNCSIERPDWGLSESWNRWCLIEELALDGNTLGSMIEQWQSYEEPLISLSEPPWHDQLDTLFSNLSSA